jgi:hypothetical protein
MARDGTAAALETKWLTRRRSAGSHAGIPLAIYGCRRYKLSFSKWWLAESSESAFDRHGVWTMRNSEAIEGCSHQSGKIE